MNRWFDKTYINKLFYLLLDLRLNFIIEIPNSVLHWLKAKIDSKLMSNKLAT